MRIRRGQGAGTAMVSVRVRDLAQLFNSLDPSPFWDRDLDREAAEFIEEEFSDKRSARQWHLSVHASESAIPSADLRSAVARYYRRLADFTRRRQREQMRIAQLSLLGGATIFVMSMGARSILARLLPHDTSSLIGEGLMILAWLALWRPTESLVYGWVPLSRKRRLYERLAAMRVSVRVDVSGPNASHALSPRDGTAMSGGAPPDMNPV